MEQSVQIIDRAVQEKRQEKIDEGVTLRSLHDELDNVKLESVGASISLQNAKTAESVLAGEVSEKERQLDLFHNRVKDIKNQLLKEKNRFKTRRESVRMSMNG
jgi:hypothetical protein